MARLGVRNDVGELLRTGDVFLVCSDTEGFPFNPEEEGGAADVVLLVPGDQATRRRTGGARQRVLSGFGMERVLLERCRDD